MARAPRFDVILALTILFLLIFGLVMITSIGVPKSIALSAPGVLYPNCSDANVDCYLLFKKHLVRLGIGIVAFLIAWKMPLKFWKRIAPVLFGGTIIMLIVVLVMGSAYGTIATSWFVFFNTSLQPSEFAKLSAIIYFAYWFSKKGDAVESFQDGFIPFCVLAGALTLPVMMQNDFGSTFVIGLICATIYFVAGAKFKHLGVGIFVALLMAIVVISAVPHVRERFQGFSKVNEDCVEDFCWQSQQANIAVGSGGFFGKGLTQGVQKSYWLPQASDDFIFAASAEELGFIRIIFVILAYLLFAIRGYSISNRAQNGFEMYVAVGITTWIMSQAFINIAVNTAVLPVTGITLPFVSYGGSSLVACLIGVGVLLNISENSSIYANSANWRRDRRTRYSQHGRYRRS